MFDSPYLISTNFSSLVVRCFTTMFFFYISSCGTDDWRHHSIVTRTIWEILASVSLTYVSCGDTRSLLCYSDCASAVRLHFRDRCRRSDVSWLLPDTHNNAEPTDCCSNSRLGEGWNCIMTNVMHSLLGMVSAPRRWHHTWTTAEVVQLPLKMG
jgi:hypothetical protein